MTVPALVSAILSLSPASMTRELATSCAYVIERETRRRGVDPVLFLALVTLESQWNVNALNKESRAAGLSQVHPVHYERKGREFDPFDPRKNLAAGIRILAGYIKKCGGNEDHAVSLYVGHGVCRETMSAARVRATMVRILPWAGRKVAS